MDLREDPAQRQFRAYLRKLCHADGQPDLVAAGVVGLNLPLQAGGLELGEGSLVIAFDELGAALVTGNLLGTLLAADCLVAAGPGSSHRAALSEICQGRLTVGVLDGQCVAAGPRGDLPRISGTAPIDVVPPPTHLLITAVAGAGTRWLALVPASRARWAGRAGDGRQDVIADRLVLLQPDHLAPPERAEAVWRRALSRARLHQAAYLTGLAAGAWELTAEHVRTRRQFGAALVEHQAVAFPMAALAARLEATRLAVQHAAWAEDTGRDATDLATQAMCLAAELALDATRLGMHLHGARGLLLASPIQRYYRRAMVEAVRFGRIGRLWQELGARRLAGQLEAPE